MRQVAAAATTPPPREVISRAFQGPVLFLTPTIFLFFPFREPDIKDQDIQKQLHIREKKKKTMAHAQEKAQKRHKRISSLRLRLS